MQSVTPVLAVRETVTTDVAVSSAAGGAGSVFGNTSESTAVTLRNIGAFPFEYRVGTGSWTRLELNNAIAIAVNLATTTIRLRKSAYADPSTARFEVESLTGDFVTAGSDPLDLGGDGGGSGAVQASVTTVTETTTLGSAHYTVLVDATAGAVTINLPSAASAYSAGRGRIYQIKKIDAANTVTVDGNGAETIDGQATLALTAQWQSVTIQSNGTSWSLL